ncbi:MAG TPA: FliM/FliN family flagellar motor C-terminal domain-containing protein [candidate division Zixibacteria bacterium]|nr:FliM/FliN family flagellar motor C-terminal domain-containing protein [candidate division Zixibacteria bacterium]
MQQLMTQSPKLGSSPAAWEKLRELDCTLTLEIPVPHFTVSMLLSLSPGDLVNSEWLQGTDVPVHVNGRLIGWTEFEVMDDRLAVRMTELA